MLLQYKGKLERIKMVLDAARRYLNVVDISGEDLEITLTEGRICINSVKSGLLNGKCEELNHFGWTL